MMEPRRCTLCGQTSDSGAGKSAFICDACLGLKGREVGEVMTGFASAEEMTLFLSQQYRVPTVDLREYEIAEEVRSLVPRDLCERHVVMPVSRAGGALILAVTDPSDIKVLDRIREAVGMSVEPVIASADAIRAVRARYWRL